MAERNNGISPGNRGDRGMPIMDWYDVGRLTYVSSIAGRPQVAGRHQARSSEGPILCRQPALSRHFTYPGRGHPGFRPSKPVSPKRQNRLDQLGLNFRAEIMNRYLSWFGEAHSKIYARISLRPFGMVLNISRKKEGRRKKDWSGSSKALTALREPLCTLSHEKEKHSPGHLQPGLCKAHKKSGKTLMQNLKAVLKQMTSSHLV